MIRVSAPTRQHPHPREAPRYSRQVVAAPTADGLYASAASFAQSALEAHHRGAHQRVALDAGTALEHLTKACLAKRSPALLAEMKTTPNNWASLVLLCGHPEGRPKQLRTVGLREARERVKTFFTSSASDADLTLLIDLRDGVVHAALNDEVEERLLVAFVQQADATLIDMERPRASFWGDRLDVVDALLADASDKVAHRVRVKLKNAKVTFDDKFDDMANEQRTFITSMTPVFDETEEATAACPACGCKGIARGDMRVDDHYEMDSDGEVTGGAWVVFVPSSFHCQQCGLRLDTPAEVAAAGMPKEWERPDLHPSDFYDDDYDYPAEAYAEYDVDDR